MLGNTALTPWRLALGLGMTLAAASAAHAQDNGIYVGGSLGDVSSDYDWRLGGAEGGADDESAFKVIGGVRPFDPFAVEVNYVDLGRTTVPVPAVGGEAAVDSRALSVSAVGFYALPLLDVFGRVGVARWESEPRALFASFDTDDGTDLTYGVGAQIRLGGFSVRAEYETFDVDDGSVDLASIGVTYTFF